MPHTDKPAHTLTESIDQLERIREELLRIQRALEKIERAPPDADPPSEASWLRCTPFRFSRLGRTVTLTVQPSSLPSKKKRPSVESNAA